MFTATLFLPQPTAWASTTEFPVPRTPWCSSTCATPTWVLATPSTRQLCVRKHLIPALSATNTQTRRITDIIFKARGLEFQESSIRKLRPAPAQPKEWLTGCDRSHTWHWLCGARDPALTPREGLLRWHFLKFSCPFPSGAAPGPLSTKH